MEIPAKRRHGWTTFLLCAGLALLGVQSGAGSFGAVVEPAGRWHTLSGEQRDAAAMEAFMRRLMDEHGVTALSVAVIEGGYPVFERTLGVVDRESGKPADERTVFRAASLTKPVFAYLVMKLVDEGVLDLDRPVYQYLERPLYAYPSYVSFRDDPRHEQLTARLLLSHQGGLPNWRRIRPDGPIEFDSSPGDHFAYSGEGYSLLQLVIEAATGQDLHTLGRDKVFVPLGMTKTSFLWESRFDGRFAVELRSGIGRFIKDTRRKGNAAATVIANASDYARFLGAVMNGHGLRPHTHAVMLEPRVAVTSKSLFSPPGTDSGMNRARGLAWALGWGRFHDAYGQALFHVGREEGCENYALAFLDRGVGVVILSLTTSPDSFTAPLVDYAVGKAYSPLEWLEYGERPFFYGFERFRRPVLVGLAIIAIALVLWRLPSVVKRGPS